MKNSFIAGASVYMAGIVYVKDWKNNKWFITTINDSINCIPSVKTNVCWKEYLGICRHVLLESNEIKFATHGDYLVKVTLYISRTMNMTIKKIQYLDY